MVKFSRSTGILLTVGVTLMLTDLISREVVASTAVMQNLPNPFQRGPQAPAAAPQGISPQMVSSAVQGANQGQAGPATLNPAQQGVLNQSLKQPTPAPGQGVGSKPGLGVVSGGAATAAGGGGAVTAVPILNKTCFSALHCNDIDDFKGKCLKKQKKLEEGQEDHDEATYKSIAASVLKNTKKFKRCVAKAKKEAEKEKKKGDSTFYDFLASAGYFPEAAAAGAKDANAAGTPGAAGANGAAGTTGALAAAGGLFDANGNPAPANLKKVFDAMGNPINRDGTARKPGLFDKKKGKPAGGGAAGQQAGAAGAMGALGGLMGRGGAGGAGGANPNQLYDHRGNPLPPGSANAFNAQGMPVGPTGQPRQLTLQERQMGITGGVPQPSAQAGRGGLAGKLGGLFGGAAGGGALGALTGKGGAAVAPSYVQDPATGQVMQRNPQTGQLVPAPGVVKDPATGQFMKPDPLTGQLKPVPTGGANPLAALAGGGAAGGALGALAAGQAGGVGGQQAINPATGQPYPQGAINPQTGQPFAQDGVAGGQPAINPATGQPYPQGAINPQTGQPFAQGGVAGGQQAGTFGQTAGGYPGQPGQQQFAGGQQGQPGTGFPPQAQSTYPQGGNQMGAGPGQFSQGGGQMAGTPGQFNQGQGQMAGAPGQVPIQGIGQMGSTQGQFSQGGNQMGAGTGQFQQGQQFGRAQQGQGFQGQGQMGGAQCTNDPQAILNESGAGIPLPPCM